MEGVAAARTSNRKEGYGTCAAPPLKDQMRKAFEAMKLPPAVHL